MNGYCNWHHSVFKDLRNKATSDCDNTIIDSYLNILVDKLNLVIERTSEQSTNILVMLILRLHCPNCYFPVRLHFNDKASIGIYHNQTDVCFETADIYSSAYGQIHNHAVVNINREKRHGALRPFTIRNWDLPYNIAVKYLHFSAGSHQCNVFNRWCFKTQIQIDVENAKAEICFFYQFNHISSAPAGE